MKIKICFGTEEKIEAALRAVNGSATAHTYASAFAIANIALRAESELARSLVNRSNAAGAKYISVSGIDVARSYKRPRAATRVTLLRGSTAWYLVGVESVQIWQQGGRSRLVLTREQADRAAAIFLSRFDVEGGAE